MLHSFHCMLIYLGCKYLYSSIPSVGCLSDFNFGAALLSGYPAAAAGWVHFMKPCQAFWDYGNNGMGQCPTPLITIL
jgi:hypothetical protein